MERVRATHEDGGASLGPDYSADSRGWRYDWSEDETRKNLLRTHTTAVSSRTLYKIAQQFKARGASLTSLPHQPPPLPSLASLTTLTSLPHYNQHSFPREHPFLREHPGEHQGSRSG